MHDTSPWAVRAQRFARRRPGPLGTVAVLPRWLLLGLLALLYVVVVTVLAFLAVVVHTLRLFLNPVAAVLRRALRRAPARELAGARAE